MDEAVRKQISALLRLASSKGASEAEAMTAASKAAELMQKHGLNEADIEFEAVSAKLKTKGKSPRDVLWSVIGRCTNCAPIMNVDWDPAVEFVGKAPGPEIAAYLVAVLNRAVDGEIATFKKSIEYRRRRSVTTRRQAVHDFTTGLVHRLRHRLLAMFSGSMNSEQLQLAHQALAVRFPHAVDIKRPTKKVRFGNAAGAGHRAGDRVNLAHGVHGQASVLQIEVQK